MCGIAGYIHFGTREYNHTEVLNQMKDAMIHRGPDDGGIFFESDFKIGLAHRRLSIIDLSPHGHQPMTSKSGRYVIVYNGEVYNFKEIKTELEKIARSSLNWEGHSDTEVMLAAIEQWGIEAALKKFNGMFAFALWDRRERELVLARDRMGEKPLYFGKQGGAFLFGSELKALRQHPYWQGEIDRNNLTLFFRHNYIPSPHSIYHNVFKLPPATFLRLRYSDIAEKESYEDYNSSIISYWDLLNAERDAENPEKNEYTLMSDSDAKSIVKQKLKDSIAIRMLADVPLGAFLSGGIDSSLVVSIMQELSSQPVKTFTIGFTEDAYNEAKYAKKVASHLGTDHTELYLSAREAMNVIPLLPSVYDEPFSDSSQIPTYLVSKLARTKVTVALSGDAGDELFYGYGRYETSRQLYQKISRLPEGMRKFAAAFLGLIPAFLWDKALFWMKFLYKGNFKSGGRVSDKIKKLLDLLSASSDSHLFYQQMVSHWKNPAELVIQGKEPAYEFTLQKNHNIFKRFENMMMYFDKITYLPDDILVKVDRAAMAVSLEGRIPLLDHKFVECALSMPLNFKYRNGEQKWILKEILREYIPDSLINRPKMGFGVPIGDWIRGDLRNWAEELLEEKRLNDHGYLNSKIIRKKWKEHLKGDRDWKYYLWDILMFQSWIKENEK